MEKLFYKGRQLVHIKDINDLIDEEGKVKSDLFNSEGALLIVKGMVPREKLFHIAVYTYEDVYQVIELPPLPGKENPQDEQARLEQASRQQKRDNLIEVIGEKTVKLYEQTSASVKGLINGEPITDKKMKAVSEIVEETLKQDKKKLFKCLFDLRTTDNYTYDHSLSVHLLMTQALEDFQGYSNTDEFWNIFKTIYGKVNLSRNGILKYGVAALLHDYGKTLIPKEILNKPDILTPEEFEIMKKHPMLGTEALMKANIDDPQIMEIVGNHHASYLTYKERGQSPLATICNIVDIYDACRSKRIYKESFSINKTLEILKNECIQSNWNPFIFKVIISQTIKELENA